MALPLIWGAYEVGSGWDDDDGGEDMGVTLGTHIYDEATLDEGIEMAEEEGYPDEVIEELEEYRAEVTDAQEDADTVPVTADPGVDPGDFGTDGFAGIVDDAVDQNTPTFEVVPGWVWLLGGAVGLAAVAWLLRPYVGVASGVVG